MQESSKGSHSPPPVHDTIQLLCGEPLQGVERSQGQPRPAARLRQPASGIPAWLKPTTGCGSFVSRKLARVPLFEAVYVTPCLDSRPHGSVSNVGAPVLIYLPVLGADRSFPANGGSRGSRTWCREDAPSRRSGPQVFSAAPLNAPGRPCCPARRHPACKRGRGISTAPLPRIPGRVGCLPASRCEPGAACRRPRPRRVDGVCVLRQCPVGTRHPVPEDSNSEQSNTCPLLRFSGFFGTVESDLRSRQKEQIVQS